MFDHSKAFINLHLFDARHPSDEAGHGYPLSSLSHCCQLSIVSVCLTFLHSVANCQLSAACLTFLHSVANCQLSAVCLTFLHSVATFILVIMKKANHPQNLKIFSIRRERPHKC